MVKIDVKEIPWEVIIPEVIRASTPFLQGITWLAISKVDKKISAMNNLIAVAEIVPTIDLGLPKGIVLAAMYDKTDEALDMLNFLAQALTDLPANLKLFIQHLVDEAKADLEEIIPDVPDIIPDIKTRKPGESWLEWFERRLRETDFTPGGKGLA
jgi:hypothetical protein